MQYFLAFCLLLGSVCSARDVNRAVLKHIMMRYEESDSDALIIVKDGKPLVTIGDADVEFQVMSITKSMLNLAIGKLIDDWKIPSIDTPVHHFFPEWNVEHKKEVTIRHLLSHTSGIEGFRSVEEGLLVPDFVQNARDSQIIYPPGSFFQYSQKGCNLLSGIVQEVTGMRLDEYVKENFFKPLGIEHFDWIQDFCGHALGMYGLEISAQDLMKVGQLILNKGEWEGKQLVSKEWIEKSSKPAQQYNLTCGLLWWLDREVRVFWPPRLVKKYRDAGMSEEYLIVFDRIPAEGIMLHDWNMHRLFGSRDAYDRFIDFVEVNRLPRFEMHMSDVEGMRAEGYLGQMLVIVPEHNLIGVRLVHYGKKADDEYDHFKDFINLVHALVK